MKKIIGTIATLLIGLLLMHGMANAQVNTLSSVIAANKFATVAEARAEAKAAIAQAKAERFLSKNFKTSAKVNWSTEDDAIRASFRENNTQTRITYDNRGRWSRTIKTYGADNLEKRIANAITRRFRGYEISIVNDVMEAGFHAYFVNIQKDKDFKQVIYYLGEITIHDQMTLQ